MRSRSPKSNHFFLIIPLIQHIKFGQNPSFGSRDRVQTFFFSSEFDIQSAGVTLKIRLMSPKSNYFFPMPYWSFYVSLVKIHLLVQEIITDKAHFHSLYGEVALQMRSKSPNSNQFF